MFIAISICSSWHFKDPLLDGKLIEVASNIPNQYLKTQLDKNFMWSYISQGQMPTCIYGRTSSKAGGLHLPQASCKEESSNNWFPSVSRWAGRHVRIHSAWQARTSPKMNTRFRSWRSQKRVVNVHVSTEPLFQMSSIYVETQLRPKNPCKPHLPHLDAQDATCPRMKSEMQMAQSLNPKVSC